jgi:catechol 2,3-dioxygenase-like lactoylglutathione lyase family enzyme
VAWSSDAAGVIYEGPLADQVTGCPGTKQRIVYLKRGDDIIELVEYAPVAGDSEGISPGNRGTMHLCFKVDDIDWLYSELTAKGYRTHCPPLFNDIGKVMYCRDPDGAVLETLTRTRV